MTSSRASTGDGVGVLVVDANVDCVDDYVPLNAIASLVCAFCTPPARRH